MTVKVGFMPMGGTLDWRFETKPFHLPSVDDMLQRAILDTIQQIR